MITILKINNYLTRNNTIFSILNGLSVVVCILGCSHSKLADLRTVDDISTLKKGHHILIELKNGTQIKGVFLKQEKSAIIVEILQDTVETQITVQVESIKKTQKYAGEKSPRHNILITAGLLTLIIVFFFGILKFRPGMGGAGV